MRIAVIGSLNMDQIAEMDVFPSSGQTVMGTSVRFSPGGKGNNQCVAAARLGGAPEMVGMLGADGNGAELRELLRNEGIETRFVFSCELPTGMAQIQIDRTGQNRICVIPSANHAFGFSELDASDAALREADILVLQMELRPDVTREAVRRARAYGKRIVFNPAPASPLPEDLLRMPDYLTPNETELSVLTGMPAETDEQIREAAACLRRMGAVGVIVTCGERGAYADCPDFRGFSVGFRVDAVDTVGAGDCFNGALAVGLAEGMPLREALRFSNAAAALSVQSRGAVPSLPYREDVERFLRERAGT
ncbi:MAG: ribokinase [Clostridia bacterium]|nr:ribokinase [Clostridia bacterium]